MLKLPEKIGLIAGEGDLPEKIIKECIQSGREIFVICLSAKPSSANKVDHVNLGIASVGKAIKNLRAENVKTLVFAGGLKRPKISSLRPDAGGMKLMAKISKARLIGDNSLLSIIINFFESEGFKVIGAEKILGDLVMPPGILGKIKPNKHAQKDIATGASIARSIGNLDIGQSVIIQNGVIIGVEAIEGTDELIKRCAKLQQEEHGGILVKMKKPLQDKRIDLPTIGKNTIINAHKAGLIGIAIEAGGALILDKTEVVNKADELGLFVVGV
ncbi:MAG: hypothetical protein K0R98_1446 [Rickettsiaceae bacterium]|jgi:DUF1009 family protein|nr:hypothetical protein [Rickettsiaceae bacterium]